MLQDPTNTRTGADSAAPGWRTNPTVPSVVVPTATIALLVAPSSGEYQVASADYVVAVDGASDGDVIITPVIISGGTGTFTPATATVNSVSALYDTFTFTPDSVAEYVLGLTNDRGLSNPTNFGYSSQSPAPPLLDLSESWIMDLHPLRPFAASQGVVPAGCAGHVGDVNNFNLLSEYGATDSGVQVFAAATAVTQADGDTLDSDSLTRNAYETIRIIDDVDEGTIRKCYSLRIDKTTSGWTPTANQKIRAQINSAGNARNTRDWGLDTWWITAIRIPASMKSSPLPSGTYDWLVFAGHHTTVATVAQSTFRLDFRGGGPTAPENAQLFIEVNWQKTPSASTYTTVKLPLIAGMGSLTQPQEVPEDTWIYIIVNHRMWHGYTPATSDIPTDKIPTGNFYVHPYLAIGDGPAVPKTQHNGLWGAPYPAGSVGWDRPHYPEIAMYTRTAGFSDDIRQVDNLGMQEYLVSDNPDPVNYPTLSAQHILDAFKESRLVTPP